MSFLSRISLANRSLVALATIAILLFGAILIPQIKQELYPSIEFPTISVISTYAGASPAIIEQNITDPLEQSFQGIQGVQQVTSYSNEGASIIEIEYNYGTDLNQASQTLTQQINKTQQSPASHTTGGYLFTEQCRPRNRVEQRCGSCTARHQRCRQRQCYGRAQSDCHRCS